MPKKKQETISTLAKDVTPSEKTFGLNPSHSVKVIELKRKNIFDFRTRKIGTGFELPEYNLYELSSAEDVDGIIRRTIQKKRALSAKNSYEYVGQNPRTVEYIKRRLLEIETAQNYPMNLLIKDTQGDIIRYHNAFWYKYRNDDNSSGNERVVKTPNGRRKLKPVCAYFRIAPETMLVKKDKYGNPIKYMQRMPDGREREYKVADIIHFRHNARAGMTFATPGLLPAVDDVRALRRIEENTELLIEQFLFPLFTMTIGTDEHPAEIYEDGSSEIDIWARKIQTMPSSGGLVLSHRHKVESVGFDKIVPAQDYLEHFLKRAYTAAGVSAMDMGDGSGMNRSTADTASKILIEDVKDYQQEFKWQFDFHVLRELLLENYAATVLTDKNVVKIEFSEIDLESMMKLENHSALMYSLHAIDEDEMRSSIRRNPIESNREKMYMSTIEKEKLKMAQQYAPKTQTGTTGTSKSVNVAKTKQQPENQHGKKSGPTGRKSSAGRPLIDSLLEELGDFRSINPDIAKIKMIAHIFSIDNPTTDENIYSRLCSFVEGITDEILSNIDAQPDYILIAADVFRQKMESFLSLVFNGENIAE